MSTVLPLRIEDGQIELLRDELDPVLPSPTQRESGLRFAYSLYRRRDHVYLGTVRGHLQGDDNKLASLECLLAEPEKHGEGYVSEAVHAIESQVDQAEEKKKEEFEDYEIYL